MKKQFLHFIFLLILQGSISHAQVYVHSTATGTNDGTSWTDAFTDLQDALAAAETGESIWVAEGTYLPGNAPTSTFLIDKNLQLYGGFVGTETSLDERGEPSDHPTILSGDVNGDDIEDNFLSSRSDNVMTVLTITSDIDNAAMIDGFIIKNGHADGSSSNSAYQRGGGIYSKGAPVIQNCIFNQNYAELYGGGIYLGEPDSSLTVLLENCLFHNNRAFLGSGAYVFLSSFNIKNCTFRNHVSPQGQVGGLNIDNASGIVQECLFKENVVKGVGGLGIINSTGSNDTEVEVLHCTFEENTAVDNGGGAISISTAGTNSNYTLKGCTITGNSANKGGAGILIQLPSEAINPHILIDSCQLSQNVTNDHGGGIWSSLAAQDIEFEISRCTFLHNSTIKSVGGLDLWGNGNGNGTVAVDHCVFQGNTVGSDAGAIQIGSGYYGGAEIDFSVTNCSFFNNEATKGGAISLWGFNDSQTNIQLENCDLAGNTSTEEGGAIFVSNSGNDFNVSIDRASFNGNEAPKGGVLYIQPTDGVVSNVSIANSLITNNSGDNSAFSLHDKSNLSLLNCTVAKNLTEGIEIADESILTLQNTILYNPGYAEFTDDTGNNTVVSNGGNMVADNSMDAVLSTTGDQTNATPDFDMNFQPTEGGNLVNAGVNDGVQSEYDLAMNPRIQHDIIDIGAYESAFISTSSREVVVTQIQLLPNPATDYINVQLPENITGTLEASLFDHQGRFLNKYPVNVGQPIQIGDLPGGSYLLKLSDGNRVFVGKFIKH